MVRKRRRRVRPERVQAAYPGPICAYAFGADARADGATLRMLTVMDECTRDGLAREVALTTAAARVIGVLTTRVAEHGAPAHVRRANGAAFVALAVQRWRVPCGVQTRYSDPGTPGQTGTEERFNGTVRDEGLTMHGFTSLAAACVRLSAFRHHYNTERPQRQLGYLTPLAFKAAWREAQANLRDPHIGT